MIFELMPNLHFNRTVKKVMLDLLHYLEGTKEINRIALPMTVCAFFATRVAYALVLQLSSLSCVYVCSLLNQKLAMCCLHII